MVYPTEGKTSQHGEYLKKKKTFRNTEETSAALGKEKKNLPNMLFAFRIQ